jgi:predicted MFS family arabinose efflux permease
MLIFGMTVTMLTEFMPRKASTGVAVNNFVRNIFSCVGGVVAAPLIHSIGNGWICTIIAILAFVSGVVVIWAMKRFGPRWRKEMDKKMER